MFHNTIDKSCLRGKDEVLGKGGFGTVYRVKMYKVGMPDVSLEQLLMYIILLVSYCRRIVILLKMLWSK